MKKLIILIMLLTGFAFGQTENTHEKGHPVGGGAIWVDSLTTYSATTTSDSTYVIDLNYAYPDLSITVVDTGASITDSIALYKGWVRHYSSGTPKDTTWGDVALPVNGHLLAVVDTLIGAAQKKTYIILDKSLRLLKIERINLQVVAGIKTEIIVEGIKEK